MKVLISGGLLSDNVVNGIANRFSSGGIDFLVVPFIDDIDDIYQRGEYFDKAIILANSWNHDFEDTNVLSIKKRVSDFVTSVTKRKLSNVEIIFVAEDDDEASVIYEEILLIMNISTLVVKAPRYTVKFFSMLITTEKDKLPSDMVYEKYINNKIDTDKDIDMSSEKSDTLEEVEEKEDIKAEEKPIILDSDDIENDFELSEDDTEEPGTIEIDKQSLFDEYPGDMSVEDYEVDIDEFEETKVADNKEDEEQGLDISNIEDDFDILDDVEVLENEIGVGDNEEDIEIEEAEEEIETDEEVETEEEIETDEEIEDNETKEDYLGDFDISDNFDKTNDTDTSDDLFSVFGYDDNSTKHEEQSENTVNNEKLNSQVDDNFDTNIYDDESDSKEVNVQPKVSENTIEEEKINTQENQKTVKKEVKKIRKIGIHKDRDISSKSTDKTNNSLLDNVRNDIFTFANRGHSIVVSGFGGSGTSTVALNLANIINKLGYTVLLVDLDTKNKAQGYITKWSYDSMEIEGANLRSAINTSNNFNAHVAIVREGFRLLTMGMASDSGNIAELLNKDRVPRFINLAKTNNNFVIYDIPFDVLIDFGKEFAFMADSIVLTVACNNWGISKAMLQMCNIGEDDIEETLFTKGQLLFNNCSHMEKCFGKRFKNITDIIKIMDNKILELIGEMPSYTFRDMSICGVIQHNNLFEDGWFDNIQYSDTPDGGNQFAELLSNIVFKRTVG